MRENMVDLVLIQRRVRELAQKDGISLSDIAKNSGVSDSTLYRLANGTHKTPSAETIMRLAVYFGVSSDYLLGLTDTP